MVRLMKRKIPPNYLLEYYLKKPHLFSNIKPHKLESIMKGYVADIEELTLANKNFRQVLYTGKHMQLVLMAIAPGDDIGEEVHEGHDQFFRIESGQGEVLIDDVSTKIKDDDVVIVPAGAKHNVLNTGDELLQLYTIYSPPEHKDGVLRATKAEAEASEEHFDGKTSE